MSTLVQILRSSSEVVFSPFLRNLLRCSLLLSRIKGLKGIRDIGLLTSAIEMPKAFFAGEYLHPTVFEMAAAYMYHIICNHPFNDAKKRSGTASALIFLDMNGYEISQNKKLEELALSIAEGKIEKHVVAAFFKKYCKKRK